MKKGIIKNFTQRFSPYTNKKLSLEDRFNSQERKSEDFAKLFFEVSQRELLGDLLEHIRHPIKTTKDTIKIATTKFDNTSFATHHFINNFTNLEKMMRI